MKINEEYLEYLKGSFYKCLCLFEEEKDGLSNYILGFIYELYGLQYLVKEKHEIIFTLISILEHFYDDSLEPSPDISIIRRETFHCMKLIDENIKVGDTLELR